MGAVASNLIGPGGSLPLPTPARRGETCITHVELLFEAFCVYQTQTMKGLESYEQVPATTAQSCYIVFGRLVDASNSLHLHPPFLVLYPAESDRGVYMPTQDHIRIFTSRTLRSIVYYRGEVALETMPINIDGEEIRRRVILRIEDPAVSKKFFKEMAKNMTVAFRSYWEKLTAHRIERATPGFARSGRPAGTVELAPPPPHPMEAGPVSADLLASALAEVLERGAREAGEDAEPGSTDSATAAGKHIAETLLKENMDKVLAAVRSVLAAGPAKTAGDAGTPPVVSTASPNAHLLVQPKAAPAPAPRYPPESRRFPPPARSYARGPSHEGYNDSYAGFQGAPHNRFTGGGPPFNNNNQGQYRSGGGGHMYRRGPEDPYAGGGGRFNEWQSRGPSGAPFAGAEPYSYDDAGSIGGSSMGMDPSRDRGRPVEEFAHQRPPPGLLHEAPSGQSRPLYSRGGSSETFWSSPSGDPGYDKPAETLGTGAVDDSIVKVDIPADLAPALRGLLAQLSAQPAAAPEAQHQHAPSHEPRSYTPMGIDPYLALKPPTYFAKHEEVFGSLLLTSPTLGIPTSRDMALSAASSSMTFGVDTTSSVMPEMMKVSERGSGDAPFLGMNNLQRTY